MTTPAGRDEREKDGRAARCRVLAFGELLWDLLPTGPVLGGAPGNFAFRAQTLGIETRLVTRVGRDGSARRAAEAMGRLGLDTTRIQVDDRKPTGTVPITFLPGGRHEFEILPDVAYDFIEATPSALAWAAEAEALYFGTLAQRSAASRSSLAATPRRGPRPVRRARRQPEARLLHARDPPARPCSARRSSSSPRTRRRRSRGRSPARVRDPGALYRAAVQCLPDRCLRGDCRRSRCLRGQARAARRLRPRPPREGRRHDRQRRRVHGRLRRDPRAGRLAEAGLREGQRDRRRRRLSAGGNRGRATGERRRAPRLRARCG